jgi:5-enolpyruvylshikimate-3-phosphate synthase
MAAALLKSQGFKIKIKNPKVVNKSFPEFWKCVGVRP